MNKVISQYILSGDRSTLFMPKHSMILTSQIVQSYVHIWVLSDSNDDIVPRVFEMYNTGDTVYQVENAVYIDTLQFYNGSLVKHLFERIIQ